MIVPTGPRTILPRRFARVESSRHDGHLLLLGEDGVVHIRSVVRELPIGGDSPDEFALPRHMVWGDNPRPGYAMCTVPR